MTFVLHPSPRGEGLGVRRDSSYMRIIENFFPRNFHAHVRVVACYAGQSILIRLKVFALAF